MINKKWGFRIAVLFFILVCWAGLLLISFKPTGTINVLKMLVKPAIRFFYSPQALMLCDFESLSDLNDWYHEASTIGLSWDYATEGQASLKTQFESAQASGINFPLLMLENYVLGPNGEKDWSGYSFFKADFRNPTQQDIPLYIKIKDARSKTIQEIFDIKKNSSYSYCLDLNSVSDIIDLKNIVHISFFLNTPQEPATLFMDNVRLERPERTPPSRIGRPFLTFTGLDAPEKIKLDDNIVITCSFKASQQIKRKYIANICFFPLSAKEKKFSHRRGFLKAELWPPVPTTEWVPGKAYQIGPISIYIPYNNPEGDYGIQVLLFNPEQQGSSKPRFEMSNKGPVDFRGTFPKLRYTNKDIGEDYIVAKINVRK